MIMSTTPISSQIIETAEAEISLSVSDIISIVGIIVTAGLAIWSIIQNHCYKTQTDRFVDLQYMPEMFFRSRTPLEEFPRKGHQLLDRPNGTDKSEIICLFVVDKAPLYSLKIEKIVVDRKEYINKQQEKGIDIFPHEPYFYLEPFFPSLIYDGQTHFVKVILSYQNTYSTKYRKQIDITFSTNESTKIKCNRAERYK